MSAQHHTPLPPYRAMLVVDLKDFSGNPAVDQGRIGADIPVLLHDTFQRMGHGYLWTDAKFVDHTGDGYAMGFHPRALPCGPPPIPPPPPEPAPRWPSPPARCPSCSTCSPPRSRRSWPTAPDAP